MVSSSLFALLQLVFQKLRREHRLGSSLTGVLGDEPADQISRDLLGDDAIVSKKKRSGRPRSRAPPATEEANLADLDVAAHLLDDVFHRLAAAVAGV